MDGVTHFRCGRDLTRARYYEARRLGRQEMTIKADLSGLAEIRRFTYRACRARGFPPDACYQIKLAMDDVVINPSPEGTVIRFAKRLGD